MRSKFFWICSFPASFALLILISIVIIRFRFRFSNCGGDLPSTLPSLCLSFILSVSHTRRISLFRSHFMWNLNYFCFFSLENRLYLLAPWGEMRERRKSSEQFSFSYQICWTRFRSGGERGWNGNFVKLSRKKEGIFLGLMETRVVWNSSWIISC